MPISVKVSGVDKNVADLKVRVSGVDKNINHVFQKTAAGDKTIWQRWKGLQYIRGPSVPASNYGFAKGVLLNDGRVLLCPVSSTTLRFYTPPSGTISSTNIGTSAAGISHGGTANYNYSGGVKLPDGRVVLAPYDTANVRVLNATATSVVAQVAHGVSGTYPCAFSGGCYVEAMGIYPERVIFTPYNSSYVRWYNIAANTMTVGAAHSQGNAAFRDNGIRLANGKILFVPHSSDYVGLFDPSTNTFSNGPVATGCAGGVLLPDGKVLLVPCTASNILLYNPTTNTTSTGPAHGRGSEAFYGGILLSDLGKVILIPFKSTAVGIYDIASNTYSNGPAHGESYGSGSYFWQEGVYLPDKGTIVMIPRGCNYVGLLKVVE